MKVLFLTNIPSPYRIDFFNELGKRCELTVWFQARNEANREWRIDGLGASFRYKFLPGFTMGLQQHVNFSVVKELNAEPFDVYIMGCYSSPTEMLAINWLKRNKKRFILNSDGGFPGSDRWPIGQLKQHLISSADLWLSSGTNCTRYLRHYGADGSRIVEYPFSTIALSERDTRPLDEPEKERLKRANGLSGTVLLSIGQFIHRKGFDVLLEAFARMKRRDEATLLLIGGGPEKAAYEAAIRERDIPNVVIKDFMQKEELLPFWKLADVFVFPTRLDIWGLVVNEALTFGLPVVSTTMAGAAHDLVREGENGWLVPPEDPDALARRCDELVRDRERRRAFGEAGRELSRGYSMERMVDRHVEVLDRFALNG